MENLRASEKRERNGNMSVLESIAQVKGGSVISQTNEGGVVRMKLRVRKQDLEQMLQIMNNAQKSSSSSSCSKAEQRLNYLSLRRKKHQRSRAQLSKYWTPNLHSIPEELCF